MWVLLGAGAGSLAMPSNRRGWSGQRDQLPALNTPFPARGRRDAGATARSDAAARHPQSHLPAGGSNGAHDPQRNRRAAGKVRRDRTLPYTAAALARLGLADAAGSPGLAEHAIRVPPSPTAIWLATTSRDAREANSNLNPAAATSVSPTSRGYCDAGLGGLASCRTSPPRDGEYPRDRLTACAGCLSSLVGSLLRRSRSNWPTTSLRELLGPRHRLAWKDDAGPCGGRFPPPLDRGPLPTRTVVWTAGSPRSPILIDCACRWPISASSPSTTTGGCGGWTRAGVATAPRRRPRGVPLVPPTAPARRPPGRFRPHHSRRARHRPAGRSMTAGEASVATSALQGVGKIGDRTVSLPRLGGWPGLTTVSQIPGPARSPRPCSTGRRLPLRRTSPRSGSNRPPEGLASRP